MSVYGTDNLYTSPAAFLGSMGSPTGSLSEDFKLPFLLELWHHLLIVWRPPTGCVRHFRSPLRLPFSVPADVQTHINWCRSINLLPIAYAFRPRLRTRLTLGGLTCPRKPWVYGEKVSHLLYRYSWRHTLFLPLQPSLQSTFTAAGILPYRS